MPNNRVLPISIPQIHGYTHHAHQLSIVSVDDKILPWFYSNYIQLYSWGGQGCDLLIDFFSYDGRYPRFPGLNGSWLTKELFTRTQIDLLDFIIDSIDSNYYVEIIVDEYFIPNKIMYKVASYTHSNLIYGYDKNSKVFHLIGFDKNFIFTKIEVGFEQILEGFKNTPLAGIGLFGETGLEYSNTSLDTNIELIKTYLEDYIDSKNSFIHYKPEDARFGLDTYNLYKEKFMKNDNMDIRPLHIFWEHKKVMLNRLAFLAEQGYLKNADNIISKYKVIAKYFVNERLMLVKAFMNEDMEIFKNVGNDLDTVATQEREILKKVLSNM